MEQIREKEKAEESEVCLVDPMMDLCAFLSNSGIPLSFLKTWVEKTYGSSTPKRDVENIIRLLLLYSMIEASPETISMHSLVQTVTRDQLDQTRQQAVCEQALGLLKGLFFYSQSTMKNIEARKLISHVEDSCHHAKDLAIEKETVFDLINTNGLHLSDMGAYTKAREAHSYCQELGRKLWDDVDPHLAEAMHNEGNVLWSLGRLEEAKKQLEGALSMMIQTNSLDLLTRCKIQNNMGLVLLEQGKFREAQKSFETAYNTCLEILPMINTLKGNALLGRIYNNLGITFQRQGNLEAKLFFLKAMHYLTEPPTDDHALLKSVRSNLIQAKLEYKEKTHNLSKSNALNRFKKEIVEGKKVVGHEHPDIANLYNNLAQSLAKEKNYEKAIHYFKKALKIYEKM